MQGKYNDFLNIRNYNFNIEMNRVKLDYTTERGMTY